jgi:hypothetical protein
LQLAAQCEIRYDDPSLAKQAGALCTRETLLHLKQQGLLWGAEVCTGAVTAGKIRTLDWLHFEQKCSWGNMQRARGDCAMFKWLCRHAKKEVRA